MAIYECRNCQQERVMLRPYRYHFGPHCRCPHCGTYKLSRLKGADPIDPMVRGFLNFLERLAGGKLFHCRFCRVQFYDRRELAPHVPAAAAKARTDGGSGVGHVRVERNTEQAESQPAEHPESAADSV
jgi:hypothetical protein